MYYTCCINWYLLLHAVSLIRHVGNWLDSLGSGECRGCIAAPNFLSHVSYIHRGTVLFGMGSHLIMRTSEHVPLNSSPLNYGLSQKSRVKTATTISTISTTSCYSFHHICIGQGNNVWESGGYMEVCMSLLLLQRKGLLTYCSSLNLHIGPVSEMTSFVTRNPLHPASQVQGTIRRFGSSVRIKPCLIPCPVGLC